MNEKSVYWIWIQQALKYNNLKIKYVKKLYKDIEQFYIRGENEWRLLGIFTNKDIENLKSTGLEKAKIILNNCRKIGCEVVTLDDERFPYLLGQIEDPPAVLYVNGDISCVNDRLVIAVVGTRKASDYGFEMAEKISKALAEDDAVIVSGGALGIDSAAHESTVAVGGKTVCVLGCGIDFPYLNSKRNLKQDIIKTGGAVISEYPPGAPALTWHFPARNRIISGLAHGTVVVEAGKKSGSLITANLANEQNRDVFVVDFHNENVNLSGNLALINDGAQVINSGDEILKEYSARRIIESKTEPSPIKASKKSYEFHSESINRENSKKYISVKKAETVKIDPRVEILGEQERKIYDIVAKGKTQIDSITEKTGLPSHKILGSLTNLELLGLIKSLPGKHYEII